MAKRHTKTPIVTEARDVRFFVAGIPAPQGSMKITGRRSGHARMIHSNEATLPWREKIRAAAVAAWPWPPTDMAVRLELGFQFTPGNAKVRRNPDVVHTVKPDLDKLIRAVCDALAGIVYTTDSRVCQVAAIKRYDDRPGVEVQIDAEVVDSLSDVTNPPEGPNRQPSPAPEPGGGTASGGKGLRKPDRRSSETTGGGASRGEAVIASGGM